MSPDAFCATARGELAGEDSDASWVRGARVVCELYAAVDASRFETILTRLASNG